MFHSPNIITYTFLFISNSKLNMAFIYIGQILKVIHLEISIIYFSVHLMNMAINMKYYIEYIGFQMQKIDSDKQPTFAS